MKTNIILAFIFLTFGVALFESAREDAIRAEKLKIQINLVPITPIIAPKVILKTKNSTPAPLKPVFRIRSKEEEKEIFLYRKIFYYGHERL